MPDEYGGQPPVLAADNSLSEAKTSIETAIGHLKHAMSLGTAGAGGPYTADALKMLEAAAGDVDKALAFHRG